MQIDIAPKSIDLTQPVVAALAATEPENSGQDPVTAGKLRMQLGAPDFAGPAAPAQHCTARQTVANPCPHPMAPTRRAAGAVALSGAIQCSGNWQTYAQLAGSEAV